MFDVGSGKFLCLPMDCFIEYNSHIIMMERDGWGDDAEYLVMDKPLDFKMIDSDFMTAARVKARMLKEQSGKNKE